MAEEGYDEISLLPTHMRTNFGLNEQRSMAYKLCFCLLCPFIWIWYSIKLYIIPCFTACCIDAFGHDIYSMICGDCCRYRDSIFPADESSLGDLDSAAGLIKWNVSVKDVEWRRVHDIAQHSGFQEAELFTESIDIDSIANSQPGISETWQLCFCRAVVLLRCKIPFKTIDSSLA